MQDYTPQPVFHTQVKLPEDGKDNRNASTVRPGIEGALDRSEYNAQNTLLKPGWVPVPLAQEMLNLNGYFSYVFDPSPPKPKCGWMQANVLQVGLMRWQAPLPLTAGYIKAAQVELVGHGGTNPNPGHTNLPAVMPTFTGLLSHYSDGTGLSQLFAETDASPSATAYDAPHVITATGLSIAIGPGVALFFEVTGETGNDSAPDMLVISNIRYLVEATP